MITCSITRGLIFSVNTWQFIGWNGEHDLAMSAALQGVEQMSRSLIIRIFFVSHHSWHFVLLFANCPGADKYSIFAPSVLFHCQLQNSSQSLLVVFSFTKVLPTSDSLVSCQYERCFKSIVCHVHQLPKGSVSKQSIHVSLRSALCLMNMKFSVCLQIRW